MTIETGQTLHKENLISFRKKLTTPELQVQMEKMLAYAESCGAKKAGSGISTTYAIEGNLMDVAVYVPLDKAIPSKKLFRIFPKLRR